MGKLPRIALCAALLLCMHCEGPGYQDGSVADAAPVVDGMALVAERDAGNDRSSDTVTVAPDASTDSATSAHDAGQSCPDNDHDGHLPPQCGGSDCNDNDPLVFPGAQERCNARDNNCDGTVDFGSVPGTGDCVQQYPGVLASNRTNIRCLVGAVMGASTIPARCEATVLPRNEIECWRDRSYVPCR